MTFKIKPYAIRDGGNCCSNKCSGKSRTTKFETKCKTCGTIFTTRPSFVKRGGGLYCSKDCFYTGNTTEPSEEKINLRKYPEYVAWRLSVFKRDFFTCTKCGDKGVNLNAHHILSFSKYPDARLILDNGATLCQECHKDFHHSYGYTEFTDVDYWEWISE